MKIPEINLRYWMGRGELAKFVRAVRNYWEHVKAAFEMPLQQHDPLPAPIGLVNILAWQRGVDAREIIRKNISVGRTARETLAACVSALEEAGYIYTPFTDFFEQDKKLIEALGKSKKSGFSIDCQ